MLLMLWAQKGRDGCQAGAPEWLVASAAIKPSASPRLPACPSLLPHNPQPLLHPSARAPALQPSSKAEAQQQLRQDVQVRAGRGMRVEGRRGGGRRSA